MKPLLYLLCFLLLTSVYGQNESIPKDVLKFQKKLNQEFASADESPLTEDDRKTFQGLDFFPVDTNYRVKAQLKFFENSKPFKMKTTTDRLPVYKLYAIATFTLKGNLFQLEIYQNEQLTLTDQYENYLFLPFTDKTNGKSSYKGGRYIDLSIPEGDEIIIDFNKAYNPYCAYNPTYSCPIPPSANYIDTEVRAGVMAYKKH